MREAGGRAAQPGPEPRSRLRSCGGVCCARGAAWPEAGSPKTHARFAPKCTIAEAGCGGHVGGSASAFSLTRTGSGGALFTSEGVTGVRCLPRCHMCVGALVHVSSRSAWVGLRSGALPRAPARGAARKGKLRVSTVRSHCVPWHRAVGCAAGFAGYLSRPLGLGLSCRSSSFCPF
jgi:hypothetical protein